MPMENKLLMQDLSTGMSLRSGLGKREGENFVRAFFSVITQYLHEDKIVKIKGLGTFKVVEVSGRDSVNVNTGERIHIKGHSKITFTPDTTIRDIVNRPFADFETIILNEGVDLAAMEYVEELETVEYLFSEKETGKTIVQEDGVQVFSFEEDSVNALEELSQQKEDPAEGKDVVSVEDKHFVSIDEEEALSGKTEDLLYTEVEEVASVDTPNNRIFVEDSDIVTAKSLNEPDMPETIAKDGFSEVQPKPSVVGEVSYGTSVVSLSEELPVQQELSSAKERVEVLPLVENMSRDKAAEEKTDDNENKQGKEEKDEDRHCNFLAITVKVMLVILLMVISYLAGTSHLFESESAEIPVCNNDSICKVDSLKTDVSSSALTEGESKEVENDSVKLQVSDEEESRLSQVEEEIKTEPIEVGKNYPQVKGGEYEIVGVKGFHTLQRGESVSIVARIYFNDPKLSEYVSLLNGLVNPDCVEVGQVLKIPILKRK